MSIVLKIVYVALSIIGAFRFRKLSSQFKWVAFLFWFTTAFELSARYVYRTFGRNAPLAHIYVALCLIIHYFIFRHYLQHIKYWWLMKLLFVLTFVFCIVNSVFIQPLGLMPTYSINACSLVVIGCALIALMQMLDEPLATPLWRQSKFWLCSSFFFYHSASFIIWSSINFVYANKLGSQFLYDLNVVMCLIFYPALGIALYINSKEATT